MAWARKAKLRKYQPGPAILTAQELADALDGEGYLWWRGRPYHPKIIANWSWEMIRANWQSGWLRHASLTPEWISQKELEIF